MIKLKIDKTKHKKLYTRIPIYRKSNERHDGVDGKTDVFTISTMIQEELARLKATLKKLNIF